MTIDLNDLKPAEAALFDEAVLRMGPDSLRAFAVRAWQVVEPGTPLVWNWHLNLLCDELRRVPEETRDLVICVPPGTMKSLLVSCIWPAWLWLRRPQERILAFANSERLAGRDSRRMRAIIQSDWYRGLVAQMHKRHDTPLWTLAPDQNQRVSFDTVTGDPNGKLDKKAVTLLGGRACLALGSAVTGQRCNGMIIDDPLDAKEVALGSPEQVARRIEEVNTVVETVLPTRLNDPKTSWRVIIMQRLHVQDPAARAIEQGARHVVLDMEYDPEHPEVHPRDVRTAPGELLMPQRYDRAYCDDMRAKMGEKHYAAQYRQRPTVADGGLFKRPWFNRRFSMDTQRTRWDRITISIDANFKKADDTDFVAIEVIGERHGDFYWLHVFNERVNYPEMRQALRDIVAMYPRAQEIVVEDKANGPALIADLEHERTARAPGTGHAIYVPVVAFNPKDSKYARAQVASSFWEAGRCWLPEQAPWVSDFIDQHVSFPGGAHDDMVDAGSQHLIRASEREGTGGTASEWLERKFGSLARG